MRIGSETLGRTKGKRREKNGFGNGALRVNCAQEDKGTNFIFFREK